MIYDHRESTHDSLPVIRRYAMPNVNAKYTADRIDATAWDCEYPECAVCGRNVRPFAVHHEPPRSKGSLLLETKMGQFVVKPALFLLCEECHRDRDSRGLLTIDWEWDEGEERRWLSGFFYAHGYAEHDRRFFRHGKIVIKHRGEVREIRPEVWDGFPAIAELDREQRHMREWAEVTEALLERGIDHDG